MTAKEKAIELVERFKYFVHGYIGSSFLTNDEYPERILTKAKKISIIAVDEILNSSPRFPNEADWDDCGGTHQYYYEEERKQAELYWQNVKNEIELL